MKQDIVGDMGTSGKAMELWEKIDNCQLLPEIVGDIGNIQGKRGFWETKDCERDKELWE